MIKITYLPTHFIYNFITIFIIIFAMQAYCSEDNTHFDIISPSSIMNLPVELIESQQDNHKETLEKLEKEASTYIDDNGDEDSIPNMQNEGDLSILPSELDYTYSNDQIMDNINIIEDIKPNISRSELWYGSVMFNINSIRQLRDALRDYNIHLMADDLKLDPASLPSNYDYTNDILKINNPEVSPSFALNSIVYENQDNWVIWLNKKKVANTEDIIDIIPHLKIDNINSKAVTLSWRTSFLDILSPNWKDLLVTQDNIEFTSSDALINYSKNTGLITFTLRPNQTFILYNMSIVEGIVGDIELSKVN